VLVTCISLWSFVTRFRPVASGNLALVTELSKWVFKEKGVLRVKSVTHHRTGEKHAPREYTIMEQVVGGGLCKSRVPGSFLSRPFIA
jgi:hypothetical protein